MNETIMTYGAYLGIAVPLTIWVARTTFKNGRIFLIDCFHGNESLADSVNHLLLVGFYLVNIGFVALYMKLETIVEDIRGVFEATTAKLGVIMLLLGAMHFFNLLVLTRARKRATWEVGGPPIPPRGVITHPDTTP